MSSDDKHIIDTVVLLYFLLVGEEELLCTLVGTPLQVPLAVYDPEDRDLPITAGRRVELLSEMRQAVGHYESSARLTGDDDSLSRVSRIDSLYDESQLVPVPMTPEERLLAAKLESADALEYGVRVPLGPGEAACVAISFERDWTIATDDSDALKVLKRLHRGRDFRYERIRKLLIRATEEGHVTREEANRLHAAMRSHGFWDTGQPFAQGRTVVLLHPQPLSAGARDRDRRAPHQTGPAPDHTRLQRPLPLSAPCPSGGFPTTRRTAEATCANRKGRYDADIPPRLSGSPGMAGLIFFAMR